MQSYSDQLSLAVHCCQRCAHLCCLPHGLTFLLSTAGASDQGWQVSANSGLNRGLNRFKPSWQKQVFAGFYQTQLYNNCSIKILLTV